MLRIWTKKKVKPDTPLQAIVKRFDGASYLTLTDEEVEIVDCMCGLGYVTFDSEGEISATKRGRGIIDGSIATNYETPSFIGDYLTRGDDQPNNEKDGSQTRASHFDPDSSRPTSDKAVKRNGLRFMKRKVRPETPLQAIVRRFDGLSYFALTDEEIEIFKVMRRLGYVDFDTEGEISATKRGRGIMDGSIATNHETPLFVGDYLTRQEEASKCGTAGSRP